MKENKTTARVAAVLLLICAITHLFLINYSYGIDIFKILGIVSNISLIVLAVLLLINKKTKILIVPLGIILAVKLANFFRYFVRLNIVYEIVTFNINFIINILIDLLGIVIYVLLILSIINKEIRVNKIIFTLLVFGKLFLNIFSYVWVCLFTGINIFGAQLNTLYMLGIFVGVILEPIAFLLLYMWLNPTENKQSVNSGNIDAATVNSENNAYIQSTQIKSGHIDMLIHILLLLFTCGIWNFIWVYKTTDYLNCVEDEPYQNPGTKLLLCMFIPFYSIYWVYKNAIRIDKLAQSNDIYSDITIIATVLAVILNIVAPIIMQEKINVVEDKKSQAGRN